MILRLTPVPLQQLVLISSLVMPPRFPFPSLPSPFNVTREELHSAIWRRRREQKVMDEYELDLDNNPMWFDYPDSDTNKSNAVYKFIGEKPMLNSSKAIGKLLRRIMIGAIILVLILLVYQLLKNLCCNFQD
uniref:Uncharacterized protein C16orf92 homolog n=1 Tax=Geotrypetes seraphini TaxID=260995 RepID=A0A6P8QRL4_GEOSA|nr:uncharacterized protein C16orf92 homolog [Geotrypetes seraphini]XP_033799834.1 uncharacterized protein C16orf92 homolog [Geotrypetes seraphini]